MSNNSSSVRLAAVMDAAQEVVHLGPQEVELLKNGSHTGIAFHYPNGAYVCRLKPNNNVQEEKKLAGKFRGSKQGGCEFPLSRNISPQSLLQCDQFSDSCSSTSDDNKVSFGDNYKPKSFEQKRSSEDISRKQNNYQDHSDDVSYEQSGIYNDHYSTNQSAAVVVDQQLLQHQQLIQQQQKWLLRKMTTTNTQNQTFQEQLEKLTPQIFMEEKKPVESNKTQTKEKKQLKQSSLAKFFSQKNVSKTSQKTRNNSNDAFFESNSGSNSSSKKKQTMNFFRRNTAFQNVFGGDENADNFNQKKQNFSSQTKVVECNKSSCKKMNFFEGDGDVCVVEELWKQPTVILKPWY